MKTTNVINRLSGLIHYATSEMTIMDCDDVWAKDAQALASAIVGLNMLSDIFENLEGQDMFGEMISILHKAGYGPEDFADLGICSYERAQRCIEDYNDEF